MNVLSFIKLLITECDSSCCSSHIRVSSINKLLNGIILLIFKIWKIRDIRFVGNLFLRTSCEFHYDDIIIMTSLVSAVFYPPLFFHNSWVLPETDIKITETLDWYQTMDRNTCCRLCSTCKRQKRVEILGVRVGDLRSSDMRKDLGKARQECYERTVLVASYEKNEQVQQADLFKRQTVTFVFQHIFHIDLSIYAIYQVNTPHERINCCDRCIGCQNNTASWSSSQ